MFWGTGGSCATGQPGSSPSATACQLGDLQARSTVVLYGDSFALEWVPALDALGIRDRFKVILFSRVGCPFADLKTIDWEGSVDTGCLPYRKNVVHAIDSMRPYPSLVLLSEETDMGVPISEWMNGIKRTVLQLHQSDFPVDVMFGEAEASSPPSACLARFPSRVTRCSTPSTTALGRDEYPQTAAVLSSLHAGLVNTSSLFCFDGVCPDIISHTLVHSDSWHIDKSFAALATPGIASLIGCTAYQFRSLTSGERLFFQGLLALPASSGLRRECADLVSANGI
jgi:hypothetical protein